MIVFSVVSDKYRELITDGHDAKSSDVAKLAFGSSWAKFLL